MMSDRVRSEVWDHSPTMAEALEADAKMDEAGYAIVGHTTLVTTKGQYWIGVYEHRPPTAEEIACLLAGFIGNAVLTHGFTSKNWQERAEDVLKVWKEYLDGKKEA